MPDSVARTFARFTELQQASDATIHFDRVCVLGGSVAGLLAARVLADHARQVLIVEKDVVDEPAAAVRRGVPHGLQGHTLLSTGKRLLEAWFPGLVKEAEAGGAVLSEPERSVVFVDGRPQISVGDSILTSSRPFLEGCIRSRTLALANVELVTGQATGLGYRDGAVRQVRYRVGDEERCEDVDFVVDAMGRSTRLPEWLEQDGWDRPDLQRVSADVNYSTAFFDRSVQQPRFGSATASFGWRTEDLAGALLNAVEGDRWMLSLMAFGDDRPGRSQEVFRRRAGALPPVISELVEQAEFIGDIQTFRIAESRRLNFAALQRFPARLVSVGDAAAAFNPIWGQGITTAALQASCLSNYLRTAADPTGVAREYLAGQQVIVDAAWQISTVADRARKKAADRAAAGAVSRPKPLGVRLQRWVARQVNAAAAVDPKVAARRTAVISMAAHPSTLARPGVMVRAVAVNTLRRRPALTKAS